MAKDLKRRIVAEFSAKNRAKGVMAGFRRDMDTTGRALRRMAMGALAVAGIGGLGYMLKKQMEVIDATAKLSDRLGITTEKLIGLQHAAAITGTDAETLNKSLEIFVRRLGEMTMGSGEAKRGLDMLGLTMDQLIKLSPAEAFGVAADKINLLGTQAEKTAAAYFLFGRAGSKMLNMLEVGSEGLKEFQKEVEKLGLAFSRIDAAQVEAANDALTRARAVLTGLFRQATIELAPYIEVLADKFVDVSTAGEGLGANVVNVFESMSMAAIRFGSLIQGLSAKFMAFQAGALEGAAAILEIAAKIEKYSLGWGVGAKVGRKIIGAEGPAEIAERYRQRAAELMEAATKAAVSTYGQENAIRRFYDDLRTKAAGRQLEIDERAQKRVAAAAAVAAGPEKEAEKVISAELKKMRALEATVDAEIMMLGRLNEPRQHARMLIQYEAAAMEEFAGNTKKAAAATDVFVGKLEELEEAQKWAEVAKTMETSFAGALERLSQNWRDYGEVAKQVLHEILMETMRIMAWRPAAQALADVMQPALAGLAGALGGLLLGPGGMPTVGTVTPEAGATMAKYQGGGIVKETGPAWVHKGEEILQSGRGRGERNLIVNVNNDDRVLGPVEVTQAESYVFSDERVINLSIQAALTNARYRKSHGIG